MRSHPLFFKHVVISSQRPVASLITCSYVITDSSVFSLWFSASRPTVLGPLGVYTSGSERSALNNESTVMTPYWVKVALFAVGRSCVSVFMEWHLAGIMFHAWASALFVTAIPSSCICLNYLNQFYNSKQSTLEQEVRRNNNGPLNHFFSFSSSFYMTPLKPHNGALLAAEGETWGGWKAPALWNTLRERSLLFLHSGWPFGSASTQLTPPPPPPPIALSLALTLSAPPPSRCRLATEGWSNRSRGRAIQGADWRMIY